MHSQCSENLTIRNNMEDLGVNGRINSNILSRIRGLRD
jgi:hypothetical protein